MRTLVLALAVAMLPLSAAVAKDRTIVNREPKPVTDQISDMQGDLHLDGLATIAGERADFCGKPHDEPTSCEIAFMSLTSATNAEVEFLEATKQTLGSSPDELKWTADAMKAYHEFEAAQKKLHALVVAKFKPTKVSGNY